MEWKPTWTDPLTRYVTPYHDLIGDKRTHITFDETIRGILGAGSLICRPDCRCFTDTSEREERGSTRHSPGEWREYATL